MSDTRKISGLSPLGRKGSISRPPRGIDPMDLSSSHEGLKALPSIGTMKEGVVHMDDLSKTVELHKPQLSALKNDSSIEINSERPKKKSGGPKPMRTLGSFSSSQRGALSVTFSSPVHDGGKGGTSDITSVDDVVQAVDADPDDLPVENVDPSNSVIPKEIDQNASAVDGDMYHLVSDQSNELASQPDPHLTEDNDAIHGSLTLVEEPQAILNTKTTPESVKQRNYEATASILHGPMLYETLRYVRPVGFTEDPLKLSIHKDDIVGLDMDSLLYSQLLATLGSNAPAEILLRDGMGRNCVHLATISSGPNSGAILFKLFDCFARHAESILERDMIFVEKQYQKSLAALSTNSEAEQRSGRRVQGYTDTDGMDALLRYPRETALGILNEWLAKEGHRIRRRTEFAVETWWLRAVASPDIDGRTALHYAAILGNFKKASCLMSAKCRGRFNRHDVEAAFKSDNLLSTLNTFSTDDRRNRSSAVRMTDKSGPYLHQRHDYLRGHYSNKRPHSKGLSTSSILQTRDYSLVLGNQLGDLLRVDMYYSTLSGEEIGRRSSEMENGIVDFYDRSLTKFGQPMLATLKSTNEKNQDANTTIKGKMKEGLEPSAGQSALIRRQLSAPQSLREELEGPQHLVDYEVIVPWVLKNMLKRCTDLVQMLHVTDYPGDKKSYIQGEEAKNEWLKKLAVELMKEYFEDAADSERNYTHLNENGKDGVYVSQKGLQSVLERLGIRITEDVLTEVSLRYEYFGKVENAISEFDFDEFIDEYDGIREELLNPETPLVAERKNRNTLSFTLSTHVDSKGFDSRSNLSLAKTTELRNSRSRIVERSHHAHALDEDRHLSHRVADRKLSRTWNSSECPPPSKKSHNSRYDDEFDESDDDVYDKNYEKNKGLRRDLDRERRKRISKKLQEMARTKYVDVDMLINDIASGVGLQSINSIGLSTKKGSNGVNSSDMTRANIMRATFQSADGRLRCENSESYRYLYGDYDVDVSDEVLETAENRQIERKLVEDRASVMPSAITMGGIVQQRRAAINSRDKLGCTPLHLASASGNREILNLLLKEGADVTATFLVEYSTEDISEAKQGDKAATVDKLIDIHYDRMLKPTAITPLNLANGPSIKSILVTALANRMEHDKGNTLTRGTGSPIKSSQRTSESTSHTAPFIDSNREYDLLNNISQLHGHKFNLSKPALSWAVSILAVDTVKQLLTSLNANPNIKDAVGRTPLHECTSLACAAVEKKCKNQHFGGGKLRAMVDLLLEGGADPLATSVAGRAPLHELFFISNFSDSSVVEPVSNTAYLHHRDAVMASAAKRERRSVLKSLLHWGADPLQSDRNHGLAPIHYCAKVDAVECMMEILSFLSIHPPGASEANVISVRGGNELIGDTSFLGPYLRCSNGRSSLHIACASSSFRTIEMLVRWDADNAITGAASMLLKKTKKRVSDVAELSEEFSLSTLLDCNGKIPSQLLGQSGREESISTLWEQSFAGDLNRVEANLRFIDRKLGPKWEDINESDTLFLIENETITAKKILDKGLEAKLDEEKDTYDQKISNRTPTVISAALRVHEDLWILPGVDSKTRLNRWTPLHCCILGWGCKAAIGASETPPNLCARRAFGSVGTNRAAALSMKLYKKGLLSSGLNGLEVSGNIHQFRSSTKGLKGMCHARGKSTRNARAHSQHGKEDASHRNQMFFNSFMEGKHDLVATTLLNNRAFVDSLDFKARTPLMFASACNLLDAIALLLDAGADMSLKDNICGNTALHYAYACGSMAAASLLEERGANTSSLNNQNQCPFDVTGVLSTIGGGLLKLS